MPSPQPHLSSHSSHPLTKEHSLLSEWESRWRPELEKVQRVFEIDAVPKDLAVVARALGRNFSWYLGSTGAEPIKHWPACTIMVTIKVATDSYREGAFWEDLWNYLDVPGPHRKQRVWGEEFLRALRLTSLHFDLQEILAGHRKKYVNSALLHAGVPTYCLDDLFDLLLAWRRQFPSVSGTDHFLDWVNEVTSRLDPFDVPVRTFLTKSQAQAKPTLDRCVALLDRLTAHPSDTKAWSQAGVAERFQRPALQALIRHQNRDHRPPPQTGVPYLRFTPGQREVHLLLPPGWSAFANNSAWLRPAESAQNASPTTLLLVDLLQKLHLVTADGRETRYRPAQAEGDELLAFTRQGKTVPLDHDVLPQDLWLLHPRGSLHLSPSATLVQQDELAHNQHGWQTSLVDLPPGSWFSSEHGPVHHVARAWSPPPEVIFSEPLPGATDPWGEPVHAQRPVVLPQMVEGAPWTIQVFARGEKSSKPLTVHKLTTDSPIDPLAPRPHPQAGSYLLRAHRPGEKFHEWCFALAEGVTVTHTPSLRLFEGRELERSHIQTSWPEKLKGLSGTGSFTNDPTRKNHLVRVRAPGSSGEFAFQVETPHLEMAFSGTGKHHWSIGTSTLTPDDLRETGDLLIRRSDGSNDWENPSLVLVSPEGDTLQREQPRNPRRQTLAFPLVRFNEAAQAHHEVTVELHVGQRTCQVACVRPEPLALKASFGDDDHIHLHGTPAGLELVATLYQEHAPWREPVVLPVRHGRISTEEHFEIGGPLRILLRVDDPWTAPPRPPLWPGPADGTTLVCDMPGRPNSDDRGEDLLCAYLSGRSIPTSVTRVLDGANSARLWAALARLGPQVPTKMRERFRALLERLSLAPENAVADYAAASSSPVPAVWALILCGAASTLPKQRTDEEQLISLWEHNLVAGALLSRNALRMVSGDLTESTAVHEAVIKNCGTVADLLLRGLPRPAMRQDDESAHPAPMIRELNSTLHRSPGSHIGFLDPAVEQLVLQRAERVHLTLSTEQVTSVFHSVHAMCTRLDERFRKSLTQLLGHRSVLFPGSAHKAPALSLAMAVNARLAARPGPPRECIYLDIQHRSLWSELAHAAPELAAFDLVLAELTLTGLERAQLN